MHSSLSAKSGAKAGRSFKLIHEPQHFVRSAQTYALHWSHQPIFKNAATFRNYIDTEKVSIQQLPRITAYCILKQLSYVRNKNKLKPEEKPVGLKEPSY